MIYATRTIIIEGKVMTGLIVGGTFGGILIVAVVFTIFLSIGIICVKIKQKKKFTSVPVTLVSLDNVTYGGMNNYNDFIYICINNLWSKININFTKSIVSY